MHPLRLKAEQALGIVMIACPFIFMYPGNSNAGTEDCTVIADSYLGAFAEFEYVCQPHDGTPSEFTFIVHSDNSCVVAGEDYSDSFADFEIVCKPYEDGDNSYVIAQNVLTPITIDTTELDLNTDPVVEEPVPFPIDVPDGQCAAYSQRNNFEKYCVGHEVVDCDPIDGQMVCASFQIGSSSPSSVPAPTTTPTTTTTITTTTPTVVPETETDTPEPDTETETEFGLSSTGITSSRTPGGLSWADSYVGTDGQCWPRSGYDHGIGDVTVATGSSGSMTIREAAALLGTGPAQQSDLAFNDINCGNGPANDAGDEDINVCPGLVTRGVDGCSYRSTAPDWWERI